MSNQRLAEELHKRLIRKCKKRKVHSYFVENIWYVDLADMQLISKLNKRFQFLFCVIDICSKYAGKKLITIELLIVTATGLEPRTTLFLNEHSTIWPNWPND